MRRRPTRGSCWWRRTWWRRRGSAPRRANAYAGAHIHEDGTVPCLTRPIAPDRFFRDYVATRTPVLLRGAAAAAAAELGGLTRLLGGEHDDWEELGRAAGDATVKVEVRRSAHEPFGRGQHVRMRLSRLLRLLAGGSERYYMTTQELPLLPSGVEGLLGRPLDRVHSRVPLHPPLLPSLHTQSVNMWLGRAGEGGASSGLHHDHHDNLLCLLRGRKRVRLYSPADALRLRTAGRITRVHPNGKIVYAGAPCTADGREGGEVARAALGRVRAARAAAERWLERAESADGADVDDAEDALDATVDAALDLEMRAARADEKERRRRWRAARGGARSDAQRADGAPAPTPDNFSLGAPADGSVATRSAVVEMGAGDRLYMPCGWFHDVTSSGTHCALNFWFHPPDAPHFDAPYRSAAFWRAEWRARARQVAALPVPPACRGARREVVVVDAD